MSESRPLPRRAAPKAQPIEMQGIEITIIPSIRRAGGRYIRRRPCPSRRRARRRASKAMQAIPTAIAAISQRPATLAPEARRPRLLTNCLTVWASCQHCRDSEGSTAVSTGRRAARGHRAFSRRRDSRIGAGSRRRQSDRQRVGIPSSPLPSPPVVVRKAAPQSGSSSHYRSSVASFGSAGQNSIVLISPAAMRTPFSPRGRHSLWSSISYTHWI